MDRLKIIQVSHTFPPYVTGLAQVVDQLSSNFARLGHDVEVVTLDPSMSLKREEYYNGVKVTRFPCIAPNYNSYFFPSPKVVDYLSSVKADIIHAHNIGALLVPASWIAVGRRKHGRNFSFIVSPHHHQQGSLWHTRMMWKLYKPVAKKVLDSADFVHCVSDFEAGLVKKDFGIENPLVVPNGVADDVFKFKPNPPKDQAVLTYAGRLEGYKRVRKVIEASAYLSNKGFANSVRMIGNGPDLPNIVNLSKKLKVNLEHLPFLPREEYLRMLSTSSYFLNLSMFEAFSLTTAEALGIGVPTVVSLPWGNIFDGYRNVSIVNGEDTQMIGDSVLRTAKSGISSGDYRVRSWSEVAMKFVSETQGLEARVYA